MPRLTFAATADGLKVDVMVGLGHLDLVDRVQRQITFPTPLLCRAEIDTGSNISCVATSVLRSLGLTKPMRTMSSQSTGGSIQGHIFRLGLLIVNVLQPALAAFSIPDVEVMELQYPLPDCDVLIGLDVLSLCQFHLDGPGQTFHLDF